EFIVTTHVPVPVHGPLHPVNVELLFASTVRVTTVPCGKLAEQVSGQLIPPLSLVTVPPPLPARVTVSVNVAATVTVRFVLPIMFPCCAEMLVVPAFCKVVASPAALIVAIVVSEDAHVTEFVKFCVELSEKVPVAVNCCGVPAATLWFAGVTAIDTSVGAAVTVRLVFPVMFPCCAEMLVVPAFCSVVASPAALIVAIVVSEEAHVTEFVKFCVELSEKVPVAVNCCCVPAATLWFVGVTAIDTSVAAVTVRVVFPIMFPCCVEMLVVPAFCNAVARPAALMVGIVVSEDAHVTEFVKIRGELSEKVPVAVNCCCVPAATVWLAGVTAIDTSVADEFVTDNTTDVALTTALNTRFPVSAGKFTVVKFPATDAALRIVNL